MPQLKKEVAEAMQAIGVSKMVLPDDADTSDILTNEPAAEATPATDTLERKAVKVQDVNNEQADETEDGASEAVPEEEKERRSWQASADKAKADYEKATKDIEARQQELAIERQKNEALMNMLAGMQNIRGTVEEPAKPAKKAKADKEPELWDFIKAEDYDRDDALDPRTASGQAWSKYQRASNRYEAQRAVIESREEENRRSQQELTAKQAKQLADTFPEFKNPFTGQPDLQKIEAWLGELGQADWVTLKRAMDGVKGKATNGDVKAPPPNAEADIAKRANKPGNLAGKTGSEPAPRKKNDTIAKLSEIYGPNVFIPPDFN
jgi:hypothetical protein